MRHLEFVFCNVAFVTLMLGGCKADDEDDNDNDASTTPVESGDGDGDGDPGDGDGDGNGDGDGDPGDGDGDPGDGDGDPGNGDGDPGNGDGDGDPGDGDGDPGDGDPNPDDEAFPNLDDPCDTETDYFACTPALEGGAGEALRCDYLTDRWARVPDFTLQCLTKCESSHAVDACGGVGDGPVCLCAMPHPQPCPGAKLGCYGDNHVMLCHEGQVVTGVCLGCRETPSGYFACD